MVCQGVVSISGMGENILLGYWDRRHRMIRQSDHRLLYSALDPRRTLGRLYYNQES
jgi:hypothetical protein